MDSKNTIGLLIAASSAVTRALPVRLLSGKKLSADLTTWLKYVPVPVLSAMLAADLLLKGGELHLHWGNLYLWTAVPCFLVAAKSRSLFATVLFGMGLLAVLRQFA